MSQHKTLTHALRNLAQKHSDDQELIMQAVKALEAPPCMPRLPEGVVMIPCALAMNPNEASNGWLYIPNVLMHWTPLVQLSKSTGEIIELWRDETATPTWCETLSGSRVPEEVSNPAWMRASVVHDWRNHINQDIRDMWDTFTPDQQLALSKQAQTLADNENWDE